MTESTPQEQLPHTERVKKPSPGVPWGLTVALLLAVLLVVFAVQNTQAVMLRFLGWEGEFPLVVIIVSVAVAAIVLDQVGAFMLRRRRHKRAEERAELKRFRQGK